MEDHWSAELVAILEKNCTGSDDHDGGGEPSIPLVDRCGKCRTMFQVLANLIKKVSDGVGKAEIRRDAYRCLIAAAEHNRRLVEQLSDRADGMTATAAKFAE